MTDKQAEVFLWIVECVENNGYQPSVGEMASHFQVTRRAIAERLRFLEKKGFVKCPSTKQSRCCKLKGVKFKAIWEPGFTVP